MGCLILCTAAGSAFALPRAGAGHPDQQVGCGPVGAAEGPRSGPQVNITADPNSGIVPLEVAFLASVVGGTPPYRYAWTFGDGTSGQGAVVHHNFTTASTYLITLTVTDRLGAVGSGQRVFVAMPASPPALEVSLLLVGALLAAVVGIGLGVGVARRTRRRAEELLHHDRSAEVPPAPTFYGGGVRPPPPFRPSYLPPPDPWRGPSPWAPPPGGTYAPARRAGTWGPPSSPATGPRSEPSRVPSAPTAPTPFGARVERSPRPGSLPPSSPPNPELRAAAPPVARPSILAPSPPHPSAPPGSAAPVLTLDLAGGPPLKEVAARLNGVPWARLVEDVAHGPTIWLARVVGRLDPLVRSLRTYLQDPESVRRLLRDVTQDWFRAAGEGRPPDPAAGASSVSEAAGHPQGTPTRPASLRSLFTASERGKSSPLLDRMGMAIGELSWTAVGRAGKWFAALLLVFLGVEVATFAALYATFHGVSPSPLSSLAVPAAVLGPPSLILLLFPVVEWGHLLARRFRASDVAGRLFALPPVRMVSYLMVLGLAETSRAVADVVASTLFGTPSSLLFAGSMSLVSLAGFLALVATTLFLGWLALGSWNAGGSRRALLASSVLYLSVLLIFVGTEGRLLVGLGAGATWASVTAVQGLLWQVPALLLVASFFAVMVYIAFSEPIWMRARAPSSRARAAVAQAYLDDLAGISAAGGAGALEGVSDLARGNGARRVAVALRELFGYDPETDRYVVLRSHDPSSDTLITVHIRTDPGGSYYVLDTERLPSSSAPAGVGGPGRPGPSGAGPSGGSPWARSDLVDGPSWLKLLQGQKGHGRLPHPASELRSAPPYRALMDLLTDPAAAEARDLFVRVGWTKPSGPMLLVRLLQAGEKGEAFEPEIETDGEYLEVELNRLTNHGEDAAPYLGPWSLAGWRVVREVAVAGGSGTIRYRASRAAS